MIDTTFPALSRAITGSLLWRIGTAGARVVAAAWRTSLTARAVAAFGPCRDTRWLAGVAALALAISVAVAFTVPSYVRSGLPVAWPLAVVALLIVIAAWPAAFERAWPRSTIARVLARAAQDR